jgi:hypothetical protein
MIPISKDPAGIRAISAPSLFHLIFSCAKEVKGNSNNKIISKLDDFMTMTYPKGYLTNRASNVNRNGQHSKPHSVCNKQGLFTTVSHKFDRYLHQVKDSIGVVK